MRIQNVDIPHAAIDAGRAAMVTGFKAVQIQAAVSASLRADAAFAYPKESDRARDELDMRVADRMIQNVRKAGGIAFDKGRWIVG